MEIRPIIPQDEAFLYNLFASIRMGEMANWGWDEPTKETFLRMQWNAQNMSYRVRFPNLCQELILVQTERAGRLLTCFDQDALLVVDISLLPKFQGQGIGRNLLNRVQQLAEQYEVPVQLTVRYDNRARRLYDRLGFRTIASNGADIQMEWRKKI